MGLMPRVVIVCDGHAWFTRRLAVIQHDLDRNEKVYHCDRHLGGPYKSAKEAVRALKRKDPVRRHMHGEE
jgi:hypothetical protein